ncbi:hypothetical protein R3P38DRAFT_3069310 [Favolaschia claudopus]|uniref:Uncharacterized protein n=1 Tax=Favolaschia claudopus TaxID=2862362 RepID=A0AAW0A0K4_9AGAR
MYTPKNDLLRSVVLTTTAAAMPSVSCVGDASEAAQSALAAGQLGAGYYDDLTTTIAGPANHHPSPNSTALSISNATSPTLSPAIEVPAGTGELSDANAYGPFIASLVNDWDEAYAEGLENVEGMKAELGDLTPVDAPSLYIRRSRRLRAQQEQKLAAISLSSHASTSPTPANLSSGSRDSSSSEILPHPTSRRSKASRKKRQPLSPSIPSPSLSASLIPPPAKRAKTTKSSSSASTRLAKWMSGGVLVPQHREWGIPLTGTPTRGTQSEPERPLPKSKTRRGRRPPNHQLRRLLQRLEIITSVDFDFKRHSSFSSTGWNGIQPPLLARDEIRRLFRLYPDARGLYEYLQRFFPVPYIRNEDIKTERATFLVDKHGQIFFFDLSEPNGSWRNHRKSPKPSTFWSARTQTDPQIKINNAEGVRGPHWPIIIGHHQASLADWHKHNSRRVDAFMKLEIVQRIISWVSSVRFRADAAWHKQRHGIEPMFGLFWNFCLNVVLPGQRRIHCDPHADMKNQIGVCVLLIYLLEGFVFDDDLYTWLVIWEAGVAVHSFYHFNLDVHMIKFVTVAGKERPTRQNSRPLGGVGIDTVQEAKQAGLTGTVDFGTEANAAFNRFVTFQPASATDFE